MTRFWDRTKSGRGKNWTTAEIETLRKYYPLIGAQGLVGRVEHPIKEIRLKASKLKIKVHREIYSGDNWRFALENPYAKLLLSEELSYIAGIIDGEGTIAVDKRGFWRISVGNTFQPLLIWLENKVPYTKIQPRKPRKLTWKNSWTWLVFGNLKIKSLLELLLPYLIIKRGNAERAIAAIKVREAYLIEL